MKKGGDPAKGRRPRNPTPQSYLPLVPDVELEDIIGKYEANL